MNNENQVSIDAIAKRMAFYRGMALQSMQDDPKGEAACLAILLLQATDDLNLLIATTQSILDITSLISNTSTEQAQ